jgi:hypothetical protein
MIVDIVDKYCTNDNNPIKNLRLKEAQNFITCHFVTTLNCPKESNSYFVTVNNCLKNLFPLSY